jgi:nucleoside-diphosphate-sugar epimerase
VRVLVTGAAGFVGGLLWRAFAAEPDAPDLTLLDRQRPAGAGRARVAIGDVADIANLPSPSVAPDVVYHCAGITTATCEANPDMAFAVNVEATRALLAWCRGRLRPPRLVFTSSVAVFGGGEAVVDEDSPVRPNSTYGATKAAAEHLVLDAARRGEVEGVVVRLPVAIVRPSREGRAGAGYISPLLVAAREGSPYQAPLAAGRAIPVTDSGYLADGLRRLASLPAPPRLLHVPSLRATGLDVLTALRGLGLDEAASRISFRPEPQVERLIEGWPERLTSRHALPLGWGEPPGLAAIVAAYLARSGAPSLLSETAA